MKSTPALEAALEDLIANDAAPIVLEWSRKFKAAHGREPSRKQLNQAADTILADLTADKSRYHFSNLKPVWNPDGKTWRLAHVASNQ